jgi:hypothetical protein
MNGVHPDCSSSFLLQCTGNNLPLPASSETLRVSCPRIHQYAAAIGPGSAGTSSAMSADDGGIEQAGGGILHQ